MRVFALLLLMLCGSVLADPAGGIDRTFTASGDVTGDGGSETLTIHVVGRSMASSFKWSFIITDSGGHVLYHVDRDDQSLDVFFKAKGYEPNCSNYESCKNLYYFQDLPKEIFSSLKPSKNAWQFDEYKVSNLRDTANAYLTQRGFSQDVIKGAIAEMHEILGKPNFHVVAVPISTVQTDSPMIWVPKVHMFVPFYHD
jgi:hypothetical protein